MTASASPRHFDKDQAMAKILDLAISAQEVIVSYCLRDKVPDLTPGQ
jgi:hypothetical protein